MHFPLSRPQCSPGNLPISQCECEYLRVFCVTAESTLSILILVSGSEKTFSAVFQMEKATYKRHGLIAFLFCLFRVLETPQVNSG